MPTPQDMPQPGMRHVGTEVRMVIRGESLAHRLLRSRLMFLLVATLALDAMATLAMRSSTASRTRGSMTGAVRCSGSPRS